MEAILYGGLLECRTRLYMVLLTLHILELYYERVGLSIYIILFLSVVTLVN